MEPAAPPSGGPSSGGPFSAFKFGLDPLFWAFAKLSVKRLLSLAPFELVPNVLSFCGRPIHRAQVMGVVVDATEGDGRKSMRVDDGTGVVPCIAWDSEMRAIHGARWHEMLWPRGGALGCLVTVFGEIGEFRGERQLKVQSLHVLDDPNAEALFYAEMDQLTRTVYMQPPPKPPAPPKRNLCWDFQKGRCAQGSMCTFLHEGGGGGAAAAATPADDAVYSAVRAFLSAREEFAYAQLTQDADVGAAARSSGARPEYLTRAIHRLVDQGEIYLRDPHADTYGVLGRVATNSAVQQCAREAEAGFAATGIPRDELLERLGAHAAIAPCLAAYSGRTADNRRNLLDGYLRAALDDSILYDVGEGRLLPT